MTIYFLTQIFLPNNKFLNILRFFNLLKNLNMSHAHGLGLNYNIKLLFVKIKINWESFCRITTQNIKDKNAFPVEVYNLFQFSKIQAKKRASTCHNNLSKSRRHTQRPHRTRTHSCKSTRQSCPCPSPTCSGPPC